jgi:hypothetical protein
MVKIKSELVFTVVFWCLLPCWSVWNVSVFLNWLFSLQRSHGSWRCIQHELRISEKTVNHLDKCNSHGCRSCKYYTEHVKIHWYSANELSSTVTEYNFFPTKSNFQKFTFIQLQHEEGAGEAQSLQCMTTDWTSGVLSSAEANDSSSILCDHTSSEAHPAPFQMGIGGHFSEGQRGRSVRLTNRSHLLSRSRMSVRYTSSLSRRLHGDSETAFTLWIKYQKFIPHLWQSFTKFVKYIITTYNWSHLTGMDLSSVEQ